MNSALSQNAEAAGVKYFFLLKNSRFSFLVNVDVSMINKMQIYLRAFTQHSVLSFCTFLVSWY